MTLRVYNRYPETEAVRGLGCSPGRVVLYDMDIVKCREGGGKINAKLEWKREAKQDQSMMRMKAGANPRPTDSVRT